jgi:alpha-N-arabinofuranosidase
MPAAQIKIDPEKRLGVIDRRIYGSFIEHLGRCVYGGVYDPGSPLSDELGLRRDVLEAAARLRIPLLRWPGGNFVSGYHWMDGIGPLADRPRRMNLAWACEDSNAFGTHEFMALCRRLGTQPYVCINLGTGTLDEAQSWVEYCNGAGNTFYTQLRRKNGQNAPFGVKLWGLGNEQYGRWQMGAKTADEYTRVAVEAAKLMKRTDPTIELVSCGKNGLDDWDMEVVEALAPYVRYHSIHLYTYSPDYYPNVFAPHLAERALRIMSGALEKVKHAQPDRERIRIAFDEWNVWNGVLDDRLEQVYDLSDALAVSAYLDIWQRNCSLVAIANYAQLVNVIAPIFTSSTGLFLQTVYYPLMLYAQHSGAVSLDALVDCDGYNLGAEEEKRSPWPHRVWDLGPFPWLDVSATCDVSGREISLFVVNRSQDGDIETIIRTTEGVWKSSVTVYEVNGRHVHARNSFESSEVRLLEKQIEVREADRFVYVFPAHSLTVLRLELG